MTETEFQAMVMQACKLHGVAAHHQTISIRSEKGLPDLLLVGHNGIAYRELKTATGKVTTEQKYWLAILEEAGVDVGVWRPVDWPEPILSTIKRLGRLQTPKPPPKPRKVPAHRSKAPYFNPYR